MRACVHIYSMMCMHEEAVALALQVIPEYPLLLLYTLSFLELVHAYFFLYAVYMDSHSNVFTCMLQHPCLR